LRRPDAPQKFADAITLILTFIEPPYRAAAEGRAFSSTWDPAEGRWR
jgi:hypothetical protein